LDPGSANRVFWIDVLLASDMYSSFVKHYSRQC